MEETAYLLGYSTANALARAMKRETGRTPGEVAGGGGAALVEKVLLGSGGEPPRFRRFRATVVAGLMLGQAGCAALGMGGGAVDRDAVDRLLDAPPVHQVHFGVLAVDASSGEALYARNAHRKFVPASNQKILVTASALSLLGADHRYETAAWGAGNLRSDGTLDGDLVVVGSGDPSLSDRYHESGGHALGALADSLWRSGVRTVTGALVVDASAWDSTTVQGTWMAANLPWRYSATGGAFALDEGELRVVVEGSARPGKAADIRWSPKGTPGFVTAHITTAHPDSSTRVRASYLPESRRLVLEGRVGAGVTDTTSVALRDPVRQAAAAFARILEERGIRLQTGWSVAWEEGEILGGGCRSGAVAECPSARRLAGLTSPPLSRLVAGILEPSQNWMTEQLIRTLGAELGEEGSWSEGIDVMLRFLVEDVGVDSLDVAPRDGSGLSAYNLVTPRALVAILRHMRAGPHADAYRGALAEPGEEDSTLRRRLLDLEGRVHAKTGTISNVNSLSGYVVRDDGREVAFSILSNGSGLPSSTVRDAIDDVVRILAR